jgi:hypothetical protein
LESDAMRGALLTVTFLGAAVLGGCASDIGPSPAELKAQWEAQNVYPQAYKGDLLAFMRTYLNDPTHVRGAVLSQPALKEIGPGQRYVACLRYNARDMQGKYMGLKGGAAVYVLAKLDRFIDTPPAVKDICKDAVYAPFPELEALTR